MINRFTAFISQYYNTSGDTSSVDTKLLSIQYCFPSSIFRHVPQGGHRGPYQPSATGRAAPLLIQPPVQSEALQCERTEEDSYSLVSLASTGGCQRRQWHPVEGSPSSSLSLFRMKLIIHYYSLITTG